jgi:ABC-type Mn2+/Zn2+ transport system permease subunit
VIPAAAARNVGRSLAGVVGWAMLIGVLGVGLGFAVGHAFGWPEGASIVLAMAFEFLVFAGVKRLRG